MASLVLAAIALVAPRAVADSPEFRAGAATADLTPQEGVSLDGPISKNGPVKGVHDPLKSRALVLSQGDVTLAIVVNDMCIIDQPVYDQAKDWIRREINIPPDHVLMSATHSHATPRVMRISDGPLDRDYRDLIARRMADAVIAAYRHLAPAKLGFGSFDQSDYVVCRRSLCKVGSVSANPFGVTGERVKSVAGSSNQILKPAGPVDPQVSVLSVQHTDGTPLGLVANFSVHYCGGYERGMVSADYFGAFARCLTERIPTGEGRPPFVGMMSNGTSGDISSVKVTVDRPGPWVRIEKSGAALAERTRSLVETIQHGVPDGLAAQLSHLELTVRKPDAQRVAWATEILEGAGKKRPHRWSPIYAAETHHLVTYPDRVRIPIQVLRCGPVAIAALPCEVFAATGLTIKKSSPFESAFTISLANGYGGYLPPPQQHEWGGYETWPARSSHLESDAEPKIVSEVVRLMQEAKSR